MSSLIGEVKKSVDDYSSELFSLKSKALNIRKSVCDLDDVIGMIQASTKIQEKKIKSLEDFSQKIEEFTAEVVRIDEEVAAVINQSKEDFYNKYSYLKPDAEKNFLEKWFDNAAEWCKEHWKEILIGLSFIVIGALLSWIAFGSFLPMLLSGLKAALVSGAITGGINAGISIVSSLVQGDDIGTIIDNSLNAFGDGFAGGFMIGGIMAGTSMALSSGFRIAGKLGAGTGRSSSGSSVQTISNKFPNDNQAGKKFKYTTENGRIYIENGIQHADFVIDMNGNIHIGRGHSYLAGGSSVQAAGTMKVNSQGYVRLITNMSGHFQPNTVQAIKYPTIFKNIGLNIDNAWIRIGEFETSMSNYVINSRVFYNGPIKNMP